MWGWGGGGGGEESLHVLCALHLMLNVRDQDLHFVHLIGLKWIMEELIEFLLSEQHIILFLFKFEMNLINYGMLRNLK